MGFKALGITDHGNVGGLIKFFQECTRTSDKNGNIWLSSEQGTFLIDEKTLKISKYVGKYLNYKKDSIAFTGSISSN